MKNTILLLLFGVLLVCQSVRSDIEDDFDDGDQEDDDYNDEDYPEDDLMDDYDDEDYDMAGWMDDSHIEL